jgi:hypothetical protein
MNLFRTLWVLGLTMAFVGAVFAQTVTSTFDKDYGLSRLKTYAFKTVERNDADDPLATDTLTEKKIRDALDDELESDGYHPPPEGVPSDFLISFHVRTEEKLDELGRVKNYIRGSLIVDFYDAGTKKLVWRGIASGAVGGDAIDLKLTEEKVKDAARLLIRQFGQDCFGF